MPAAPLAVCPVLLPGRELRLKEASCTSIDALVEPVLRAMRDGGLFAAPYALFGHSMGALIAYELACGIERAGWPVPLRLVVSGRAAPRHAFAHRALHRLGDEAFLEALQLRYGGLDALLEEPELREVFLPVLRADLTLVETYAWTPRPRLSCPVEGLAGWAELTSGGFASARLPGDHFYHFAAGQAELLARIAAGIR
jgi:surfactin synthase thioesterase subunit